MASLFIRGSHLRVAMTSFGNLQSFPFHHSYSAPFVSIQPNKCSRFSSCKLGAGTGERSTKTRIMPTEEEVRAYLYPKEERHQAQAETQAPPDKKKHPLEDSFGRFHSYLRISLTERCNLRCVYCMPEEGVTLTPKENILTCGEIIRLSRLFVSSGVNKIRLTGGEPTVRSDLLDIVSEMGKIEGLNQIAITSNGIVLKRKLKDLRDAGLTNVNISLDTLDENKFFLLTRRDGLPKVLGSIEEALALGFNPVKVNCVLMKGINDNEIMDFVQMTKDRPIDFRFIEYMPFDGNHWKSTKMVPFHEVVSLIEAKSGLPLVKVQVGPHETAKQFRLEGYTGTVSFISSMTDHFCSTCNRLRITADGHLKVCLFGEHEVNLLSLMREGATDADLLNVISAAVGRKKERHAGMLSLSKSKNRPMILIGG